MVSRTTCSREPTTSYLGSQVKAGLSAWHDMMARQGTEGLDAGVVGAEAESIGRVVVASSWSKMSMRQAVLARVKFGSMSSWHIRASLRNEGEVEARGSGS